MFVHQILLLIVLFNNSILHIVGWHNHSESYASLLVLGDSVDRYMVKDWCKHKLGHILTERSHERSNASLNTDTVHELLKPYGMRRKSWDVWICEDFKDKKLVTTLSNKFGVKPTPPWHQPIATMGGLDHTVLFRNTNYSFLFDYGLAPAFSPLIEATTGTDPTGIMINSAFWDLSHPDPENFRESSEWVDSWATNTSLLMQLVKKSFPKTRWFAWHTANRFHTSSKHWNTVHALHLLEEVNKRSEAISAANGYDWIDLEGKIMGRNFHKYLRDALHPSGPSLIRLLDEAFARMTRHMAAS